MNWIINEMILYRISELMLAILIQRHDKKSFHFKNEKLTEIIQTVIKHCLDNKMSVFEEYAAFKTYHHENMPI